MVEAEGSGCPIEGYAKNDFGRCTGVEATGIRLAWRERGETGSRQHQLMEGDGESASNTGNDQVSGGTRGETTWYWYAGKEMGGA